MIEMGAYVRRRMESIVPPHPRKRRFSETAAARTRFAGYGPDWRTVLHHDVGPTLVTQWPREIAEVEARAMALRAKAPPRDEAVLRRYPRARVMP